MHVKTYKLQIEDTKIKHMQNVKYKVSVLTENEKWKTDIQWRTGIAKYFSEKLSKLLRNEKCRCKQRNEY